MPRETQDRLRREAKERWPEDKAQQDRYVLGTLQQLAQQSHKDAQDPDKVAAYQSLASSAQNPILRRQAQEWLTEQGL